MSMTLLLQLRGISKDFPGTRALDRVDLEVRAGEVHALIGENGAGKSTLMNVLAGRFADYRGRALVGGEEVELRTPRQALMRGIGVIYQDSSVLPGHSVAENIMLGQEPSGRLPGTLDRARLRVRAGEALRSLGFELPLDEPAGRLGVARQKLVEIVRAVRRDVRLMVFDEPTAALDGRDARRVLEAIRALKGRGLGIVYITHRLGELPRVADRVTVLREGRVVATREMASCRLGDLTTLMLGRALSTLFPRKLNVPGSAILRVCLGGISFELREGEILGIAGLVGSGRTRLARAIVGADREAGRCEMEGRELDRRSPRRALAQGVGMIPEDRKRDGLFAGRTVGENIGIGVLDRLSRALLLRPRQVRELAMSTIERLRISPADPDRPVEHLSGGNQQKAIVGRWLAVRPRVLIFDEPTQGVDIGTKAQIYRQIVDLAGEGVGILLISSEFVELTRLADRILVVREGRLVCEFEGTDEESLTAACVGESA
jgi:ABC-type sugar transport system ATPase subunit